VTADLHRRIIDPKVGVDCYSGTAAVVDRADEAWQDSIAEMECYKSYCRLEDPSTRVDYQKDPLGHNVQSSYSKLEEKVMGSYCPAYDVSNEDKYHYLKQILQTTSRKNYQHSDGWPSKEVQMWEVRTNLAWNFFLFADAVVEQELFPLSWRENEHISTHSFKKKVRRREFNSNEHLRITQFFFATGPFSPFWA
jgi:hypothetical protein